MRHAELIHEEMYRGWKTCIRYMAERGKEHRYQFSAKKRNLEMLNSKPSCEIALASARQAVDKKESWLNRFLGRN